MDEEVCKEICEFSYSFLSKNSFQSWKDFYLGIEKYVHLLKKDFNYSYSTNDNVHPDVIYYRLKYESRKESFGKGLENKKSCSGEGHDHGGN